MHFQSSPPGLAACTGTGTGSGSTICLADEYYTLTVLEPSWNLRVWSTPVLLSTVPCGAVLHFWLYAKKGKILLSSPFSAKQANT